MTVRLVDLPDSVRIACTRLRTALVDLLGDRLVWLAAYGSSTRPDGPKRPADLDTHAVLADEPTPEAAARIMAAHNGIAGELGIEWDSWYILDRDARGREPPRHLLHHGLVDGSWSLHRAHWLAGEYVLLHGPPVEALVLPPSWRELHDGLRSELASLVRGVGESTGDPRYLAYAVANACRIIVSAETRNVVVSKRAALMWAMRELPAGHRAAVQAANRVLDGESGEEDGERLSAAVGDLVTLAGESL